jgi:catechol 2,3-dioxygenase-like lactoylglutathione lyase family enzyme
MPALFALLFANPGAYGLTNVTQPCFVPQTGSFFPGCVPDKWAFFDPVHPNRVVHEALANVVRTSVAPVPLPLPGLLLAGGLVLLGGLRKRARLRLDLAAATDPVTPLRLLETAIYVDDLAAAEAFYGGVLGLHVVTRAEGRHVFFRCGSGMLLVFDPARTAVPPAAGALPVPPHGATGPGHVCFAADAAALEGFLRRFAAAGIAVEADFRWPNGARSIYVRDPAGNSVEFAEPALWGFPG